MSHDLLHALNAPHKSRVLVVGDIILDHYIQGDVSRISPEAPIPVLHVSGEEHKLGGAANVAANVTSMGARAHLIGVVAPDSAGKTIARLVKSNRGMTATLIEVDDRPTIVKTRMVARYQQMLRVDAERNAPLPNAIMTQLKQALEAELKQAGLVVLSDYGKGVLSDEFTRWAIARCRKAKVPVLVDPKGRDYSKYAGASAITPNRGEAEAATGLSCETDKGIESVARKLRDDLQLECALVTLGPGGVAVLPAGGKLVRIPTVARTVFDVTGAGDTFIATLATFMAQGLDAVDASRLANSAAGIKVGKFGAAAITRDELRRAVVAQVEAFDHHSKLVSRTDLAVLVRALQDAGRRVVFTNGCFDILHAGHVTYLHFCKSQGDVVVVGLNSDASVRRQNKAPDRPINSEDDRARVLAALADVDFVTIFDETTPEKLIRALKPDVLVKGEDWKGKQVAGAEFVEVHGGRVAFAPLLAGRSTTKTLEKARGKGK